MVGVIVGVQDVGDPQPSAVCDLEVDIDVESRIDDHRLPAVAQQVRGTSEISI